MTHFFFRLPFGLSAQGPRGFALSLAGFTALALLLSACSPALNWRLVRTEAASLTFLLPCKPDRASKVVPLGGQASTLSMVGCEADGAMFALAVADTAVPAQAAELLTQWQSLTLTHMRAGAHTQSPFLVVGASSPPSPVRVQAQGQQADGRAVQSQAVYFARGSQLFQAVIYAPKVSAEMADTFFGGIKLE
jgi:hypothetical protein